jgi:hypothetical protein
MIYNIYLYTTISNLEKYQGKSPSNGLRWTGRPD